METKTYYQLTPSQIVMFYTRKFSRKKSVVNVPTSIIVHDSLDLDVLENAVKQAIQRWDAFGIRMIKEGGMAKQYFGENEVESIVRLDFSNKTREEMEFTFAKLSVKKLGVYNSPMARIYIITTPEGFNGLFTVISHLIMDSWAISSFYKDVMDIYYYDMGKGEYPKDVVPYEEVLSKELDYRKTPAYERAKAYWENEFKEDEPIYTDINGSKVLERHRSKKGNEGKRASNFAFLLITAANDLHWIGKEEIDLFTKFIKNQQLPSLQVLFQMGVRTFLARENKNEKDISTYNVVARRGTLKEKRTGGTRVHFMNFRTFMDESTTFIEGCHKLLTKQNELYRHADFDPFEMMSMEEAAYNRKETERYCSLAMTFQPVPMSIGDGLKIETKWYSNGTTAQLLYITIMDGDGTGGLKCYYEYMSNLTTAEKIKEFHESIVKIMVKGCENPDITLEELFEAF
ncbi:MAG: hypothetical protein GX829_12320 [Clostridium sp.]|nr:hypothetical protein [Clostridium sp.]